MEFEFATATRIVFGRETINQLPDLAKPLGGCALVVTGRRKESGERLADVLAAEQIVSIPFQLAGEPTVHDVLRGTQLARSEGCDLVVGFGGGSALDAAKAIAALLTNTGDLYDYLEVVGRGQSLSRPSAPCVAIPTTAGTGAEVTRNSVLASPEHHFKVSLRSPYLLPRLALIDPQLSGDLPAALTASTGLDALTQLIEPYVSRRANPMTDGFCLEGLGRVARSLRRAYTNGQDLDAREDMALASLLSGLSLANAALGAVHGFAAPLGGMYSAPHGAICAALLPQVMDVNVRALEQRQPDSEALRRYTRVAQVLTGTSAARAADGLAWVQELCRALNTQSLSSHGVLPMAFDELVEKASKASSMRGNPITLTPAEMREILERSS